MKTVSAADYYQEANDWQAELKANRERVINIYQKTVLGLLGCVCSLSIGLAVTISKKDVVPFLAIADKRTGEITTPKKIEQTKDLNFAMLKYLVRTYVQSREAYNPIDVNAPYHQVLAMSSSRVARPYQHYMQPSENKESPITLYGKEKYVVVEIQSVNQLPGNRLLDARFTQKLVDANTDQVLSSHDYRVTLSWDLAHEAQTREALERNPLNFKVTHYDKQPITV